MCVPRILPRPSRGRPVRNSTWAFKSHRAAKRRQAEADRQAPPAAYAANEFFSGAGWSATAVMRISKRHGVAEAFWHEQSAAPGARKWKGEGTPQPQPIWKDGLQVVREGAVQPKPSPH